MKKMVGLLLGLMFVIALTGCAVKEVQEPVQQPKVPVEIQDEFQADMADIDASLAELDALEAELADEDLEFEEEDITLD